MLKKIIKFLGRHKIITTILVIVIIVAGYFGYKSLNGATGETRYVLAAVEKGTISQIVSGTGQVSASDQLDIKPSVSGNITKSYVVDGQAVKSGDLLFQIDSQDAQKAVKDASASLENAKISLAKLEQGSTAQDIANSQLQVDSAQNSLVDAQNNLEIVNNKANLDLSNAYDDARTLLQDTYGDINDILNRQVSGMFTDYGNSLVYLTADSQAQIDALSGRSRAFDALEKLKNIADNLPTDNSGVDEALVKAENYLVIIQDFASSLTDSLNSAITSSDMTQSTINGYKSTASSARSSAGSAKSAINTKRQAIVNQVTTNNSNILTAKNKIISSQNSLAQAQNNLTIKKAGADQLDLRTKQISVSQAATSLANAQSKLSDYTIKATFDGIVTGIVSVSGYTASANTVLATVITKQQIANISLNEVDATNVKVGQKATLTFDAVSDLSITGNVVQMDAIGTVSQGVVSYGAKIALDTQDDRIKPGMSASANIILNAKADIVLVPSSAIKTSGSSSYVEVLKGVTSSMPIASDGSVSANAGNLTQATIETGISDDTYTEVISGLNVGDLVVTKIVISTASTATSQTKSLMQLFGGGGRTSGSSSGIKSSSGTTNKSSSGSSSGGDFSGPPPGM